jgi:hypothetical protein
MLFPTARYQQVEFNRLVDASLNGSGIWRSATSIGPKTWSPVALIGISILRHTALSASLTDLSGAKAAHRRPIWPIATL